MRLLVLGLGAIGQRHVRLAKELVDGIEMPQEIWSRINYLVTDQLRELIAIIFQIY